MSNHHSKQRAPYICTCGGAGPRGGCDSCRIQWRRTGTTERTRKIRCSDLTVDQAEELDMDAWMRLPESVRRAVVAEYCEKYYDLRDAL